VTRPPTSFEKVTENVWVSYECCQW